MISQQTNSGRIDSSSQWLAALALGIFLALVCAAPARAADGYIRVSQIGYESGRFMRAYLMTLGSDAGATFRVQNSSGATAYSAPVGQSVGTWGDFTVYVLDFRLRRSDTYTITVTGPILATSPAFPVDSPRKIYPEALGNALYFYQNERDGADFIPTPLRSARPISMTKKRRST